ncbi:hypothetical protein RchiOBHm_Chr5g0069531 [Rosa chinensis]|uniref:Uncharacterized protein n=1 Tax=Rosa chinensis TaxID=74649 RepID=A0A2P6QJZ7_ROSCH|nr:hypothetical protein RchiOBHm_Chr5g0069531 [Rosa chinensis]
MFFLNNELPYCVLSSLLSSASANKEEGIPTDFMMSIQLESHKNGNGGSELKRWRGGGGVGGSESQKDGNGRCKISNGTSGKDAKLVERSGSTIDGREFRPWFCKCQRFLVAVEELGFSPFEL